MKQALPWMIAVLMSIVLGINLWMALSQRDTFQLQNTSLLQQRDSLVTLSATHLQVANSALDSFRYYQSLYDSLVAHEPSATIVYLHARDKWAKADCTMVYGYLLHRPTELWTK